MHSDLLVRFSNLELLIHFDVFVVVHQPHWSHVWFVCIRRIKVSPRSLHKFSVLHLSGLVLER